MRVQNILWGESKMFGFRGLIFFCMIIGFIFTLLNYDPHQFFCTVLHDAVKYLYTNLWVSVDFY